MFDHIWQELNWLFERAVLINIGLAFLYLTLGHFIARGSARWFRSRSAMDPQLRYVGERLSHYVILAVTFAAAASQLGFNLRVFLGAAGVLTVALGFAAQASASNLISGIFLMIERPFVIGDSVEVGEIRGEVTSIDLLTCKVRTYANVLISVPNETMVKSAIKNLSHFAIQRIQMDVSVEFQADFLKVEGVLKAAVLSDERTLRSPEPQIIIQKIAASSVDYRIFAWTAKENVFLLQSDLYREILLQFRTAGIRIPYPLVVQQ